MIKVIPRINYYNQQSVTKGNPSFLSSQLAYSSTPNRFSSTSDTLVLQPKTTTASQPAGNFAVIKALGHLKNLHFDKNDVQYVQSLGAVVPFPSPNDALKFIKDNNISIRFCDLASPNIHAQYDFDTNVIEINEIYENTKNPAEILAIAEAILHEVGHAKDKDGESSIQEEFDCLAMNALSHRVFSKKFPNIFSKADSPIVQDGVCVYSKLFFDKDSNKMGLIKRLHEKYGNLPAGDFVHPASEIAIASKDEKFYKNKIAS